MFLRRTAPALSRPWRVPSRGVFLQTKETPNPDSLKFYPTGLRVLEEGTADFPNLRSAARSPLARALLAVEGITGVFMTQEFVTVSKVPELQWSDLKPAVFETMMDFFAHGRPVMEDTANVRQDTLITEDDDEVTAMIKEILDTRVRPAVQEDGGDIEYRGFEQGVVLLKMQGSCSGCPSSSLTLKNGIERMLQHWVPEVTNVVAVQDDDLAKINLEAFEKVNKNKD